MTNTYEIRQLEGKGSGIVATENTPPGSLVFTEKPILTVYTNAPSHLDIEDAFERLNTTDQQTYLSLYAGLSKSSDESRVVKIYRTNNFEDEHAGWVFPLISRINHSCVPNAIIVDSNVFAQKDITIGEEIQICYKQNWHEVLMASQRNLLFKNRYGFTCTCSACVKTESGSWLSDGRRVLIGAIRYALEGQQPTDFKRLLGYSTDENTQTVMERAHWPPKVPRVTPIRSLSQRIEYTLLLAKLREAEGLGSLQTGRAYVDACGLLAKLLSAYNSLNLVPGRQASCWYGTVGEWYWLVRLPVGLVRFSRLVS